MGNGILLVGRASRTGLGAMTLDFFREIGPERTVIIDVRHPRAHLEPFLPHQPIVHPVRAWQHDQSLVRDAIEGMRYVVGFETLYSSEIYAVAREMGVKVIIFPMWECSPNHISQADLLLCTTDQDLKTFTGGVPCDWPVSGDTIHQSPLRHWPPKLFVHNAGHLGGHGRNNTEDVIAAAKYLEGTGAELLVRAQEPIPATWLSNAVRVEGEVADRRELYAGDVSVFPMGFEGLSLPLNEAAANQMPTIVLNLPQWRDWPYRTLATNSRQVRHYRRVTQWRADVPWLGKLMREMALGKIERLLPPRPPTWSQFREWWGQAVNGQEP